MSSGLSFRYEDLLLVLDEARVDHAESSELVPPEVLDDVLGVRVGWRVAHRHALEARVKVLCPAGVALEEGIIQLVVYVVYIYIITTKK